jgi:hypothetical protein
MLALVHSKPGLILRDLRDAHSFILGQKGSSLSAARYDMLYFVSAAIVAYHHSKLENGGVPSPLVAAIASAMALWLNEMYGRV